jgi:hypothetical protein
MASTTYQVILSTDGKHTVIVTTDNQGATQLALAWAEATYERLVAQYGLKGGHPSANGHQSISRGEEPDEPPLCAVHRVPMARVRGKKGEFWSCHQQDGDTWCAYKPPMG